VRRGGGGKDVSRRHAEIVLTPKGYVLVDSSTNGTFVNEERVEGQRILARADVLRAGRRAVSLLRGRRPYQRCGTPPPGPAASPPQAVPPASAARHWSERQARRRPARRHGTAQTYHACLEGFVPAGGAPGELPRAKRGMIGQRLAVKTPIANIGRADYNDLVVPDPSISPATPNCSDAKGLGAGGPRLHQRHVRGWGAGEGGGPLAPRARCDSGRAASCSSRPTTRCASRRAAALRC